MLLVPLAVYCDLGLRAVLEEATLVRPPEGGLAAPPTRDDVVEVAADDDGPVEDAVRAEVENPGLVGSRLGDSLRI